MRPLNKWQAARLLKHVSPFAIRVAKEKIAYKDCATYLRDTARILYGKAARLEAIARDCDDYLRADAAEKRWTAALCLLRADYVERRYWTVVIPFVGQLSVEHTMWHPTTRDFAPLARGAFQTQTEAHEWAARNLQGGRYTLRAYNRAIPWAATVHALVETMS